MEETQGQRKIALLIDAENITPEKVPDIIQEVKLYGHIITKRAYANWSKMGDKWVDAIRNNAIETIHQFDYTKGKNSSDITLVIDAMDLLYTKKYDTFVIASSDSDFTGLINRIHNDEIYVIGFGSEKTTPVSLQKACDVFKFLERLNSYKSPEPASDNPAETAKKDDKVSAGKNNKAFTKDDKNSLMNCLQVIAESDYADNDGWVNLGAAGSIVQKMDSTFNCHVFGYSSIVKLVENELKDLIEIKRINRNGTNDTALYRIK